MNAVIIILGLVVLGTILSLTIFIFLYSQKQIILLIQQLEESNQRVKQGKRPIPNQVKDEPNSIVLTEENRIPWEDLTGVQVEGGPKKKIKIYR